MTYEQTLKRCMELYPSLFIDENSVLHHLFFVNGNGYEWENGQLVDVFPEYKAHIPYAERVAAAKAEYEENERKHDAEYKELLRRLRQTIYPLSQFSHAVTIPDDVQPDWLEAAQKAMDYALTLEKNKGDMKWLVVAHKRIESLRKDK
jgi:hypothetical protein